MGVHDRQLPCAPFSAAESSALFRRHPGWFVAKYGRPKPCYRNWGKTIYGLDTTNPRVQQWLHETFTTLQRMGFSFFESDDLELVDERGRALLREAAALRGGRPPVTGLMEDDFCTVESRGRDDRPIRLAANLSESDRTFEGCTVAPRSSLLLGN